MTKEERVRRRISDGGHCTRCEVDSESSIHVLRECYIVKGIWSAVIPTAVSCIFAV